MTKRRRVVEGVIVEQAGPELPRSGRLTAKVRQALANHDRMMADLHAPTITPQYRQAAAALDYILKVLTPAELTAYYGELQRQREQARVR